MLAGHFEIKHFRDKSVSLGFGIKMLHFNLEFYLMIFSAKTFFFQKVHGKYMEQRKFSFFGDQSTLGAKICNQPLIFDKKFLLNFLCLFVSNKKIYEVC